MAKPHSTIVRKNGKHIEGLFPDFKHLWHRSSVLSITQSILSANVSQITQDLCKSYPIVHASIVVILTFPYHNTQCPQHSFNVVHYWEVDLFNTRRC